MISSISSANSYLTRMMTPAMQQQRDNQFSKVDSNRDGGVDKTEFSALAKKLSKMSGSSINTDEVFSTYDADGDSNLNVDELGKFGQEMAPMPPQGGMNMQGMPQRPEKQNVSSTYGVNNGDQISQLIELLQKQSAADSTGSGSETSSKSEYASQLLKTVKSMSSSKDANSTWINITA